MKLFNRPVKPVLKTMAELLEVGGLYRVKFINEDYNEVHLGPYVYLGFGQDESVTYLKTGYLFLDVEKCNKICIDLPYQAKLERLDK